MDKDDEDVETYRCANAEIEEINDWNTQRKVWDPRKQRWVKDRSPNPKKLPLPKIIDLKPL